MSNKVPAYLAGPIRGARGDSATNEEMDANCTKILKIAKNIREHCKQIELFCPHEWEIVMRSVYMSNREEMIKPILAMDKNIIRLCKVLIVSGNPRESAGVMEEVQEAQRNNVFVFYVRPNCKSVGADLRDYLRMKGIIPGRIY